MIQATGVRIGWLDVPPAVREAVEAILGAPVVSAVSQAGGFSPGTADRVVLADGRRAFVKAVGRGLNETSVTFHRKEALVAATLPAEVPAPALLGVHDDGDWIALAFDDVEGRHPRTPWVEAELAATFDALADLAAATTPASPLLPAVAELCGPDLAGWSRVAADPPADLDPWAAAHLPALCAAADRALTALAGDTLVHVDSRADNLLLRPDGSVVIVDWPHAGRGAPWVDRALLLVNVLLYGGDPDPWIDRIPGVPKATVVDLLAGYAGYFVDAARLPSVPTLPTIRAFQRAQGDALLPWVAARLPVHADG
jgi:aminoglycoside phosphotransferase (APT) family kinase protein